MPPVIAFVDALYVKLVLTNTGVFPLLAFTKAMYAPVSLELVVIATLLAFVAVPIVIPVGFVH